ncbi:MAG TPA: LysM peptidoglycan-binding domain-containing protein [Salegentibacter sp.]|uniref:amino acid ABC transporter substrate-binding protein n=1 Tax=Salegentibacter sp. TaxID=1903072 RepID=UPI002F947985
MRYLLVLFFAFQLFTASAIGQEYKYHEIKPGETVYSIAKSYNISEEAIYKYNPDARNGIEVSSKLVIPISQAKASTKAGEDVSFRTHKVARKETLYSLSKQYEVSIEDIKRYNPHLYSVELRTGEEVRIPVGEREKAPASSERRVNTDIKNQIPDTREHVVLPKETKYGIARKYGLTVKELEALNPKVDVLQPGIMLRVGTKVLDQPVILTDDKFEFYEVQPKETLYSLSRRFEVAQDSLVALNPALEDGLKTGMVLKVPNKDQRKDDFASSENEILNDRDQLEKEALASEKLDLEKEIRNYKTKVISLMLPFNLHKIESDSIHDYKMAIENERILRISLDFYGGALMAVEEAKELGISSSLRTYDTRQNAGEVVNIINTNNFDNVDAVIGPFLQSTTEAAAARLEPRGIPVINPLSNRAMKPFDNLFQSRPTDEMLRKAMLDYLKENAGTKNIVIIADGQAYQVKEQLRSIFPTARVITPSNGNITAENLDESLVEERENWVVLESSSVGVISSVTSGLNRLARDRDITLLTTDKNSTYDNFNVSNNHLARLNLHYPSVDREYNREISREFIEEYTEKYGVEPNQYAVRGYDLTLDILLRLASAENLYASFEDHLGYTEYNENKFYYIKGDRGGYHNEAVYIMRLNEDLTLSTVE